MSILTPDDRNAWIELLNTLLPAQLKEVIYRLAAPIQHLPSGEAASATIVVDLLRHQENMGNQGIAALRKAVRLTVPNLTHMLLNATEPQSIFEINIQETEKRRPSDISPHRFRRFWVLFASVVILLTSVFLIVAWREIHAAKLPFTVQNVQERKDDGQTCADDHSILTILRLVTRANNRYGDNSAVARVKPMPPGGVIVRYSAIPGSEHCFGAPKPTIASSEFVFGRNYITEIEIPVRLRFFSGECQYEVEVCHTSPGVSLDIRIEAGQ